MSTKTKLVIIIILLILAVVIIMQNTASVDVKLLFWGLQTSLIILLVIVFFLGAIIGYILPKLFKRKKQTKQP